MIRRSPTPDYQRYLYAANLDNGPITLSTDWSPPRADVADARRYLAEGKIRATQLLQSAIQGLEESLPDDDISLATSQLAAEREALPIGRERDSLEILVRLFTRFHIVAQQLRERHGGRPTLEITDEYDVQDLLHALLRLEFDDVRPEDHVPAYAGGRSRVDFLLKREQIVVEAKRTRDGLGATEVGAQLLVDIGRYRAHPDCKTLVCFVYDPEGRIKNPRGIEDDLTGGDHGLPVRVFIRPTGG